MGKIKALLMLIIAIAFLGAAYYLIGQWQASQEIETSTSTETEWGNVTASSGSFSPSSEVTEENLNNIAEPADWKIYRNREFGFSLNVPQKLLGTDYCLGRKFEVPAVVLEDSDTDAIFVLPEYFYDNYTPSEEELRDKSGDIIFEEDDPIDQGDPNLSDTDGDGINDCRKRYYSMSLVKKDIVGTTRTYDVPLLGNPALGISLRAAEVEDTADLGRFIREVFGRGCALSKKTAVEGQEGVYDLEIAKTGEKDDRGKEMACATDKVTDIVYNPSKNRIAYALRPEGGMLFSDDGDIYDEDMIASVRLE